jgi:N-acetylglucosamine kinase-like BadF-type ATPase
MQIVLGVDGGQSHTEAVVADLQGQVLGRGRGGPSNHVEAPGGRARLQAAVIDSVGGALRQAGLGPLEATSFVAAHFAMTGEADFKHEIIGALVQTDVLDVAHDTPAALAGATGGAPGIVIIAGTGSVAFGESGDGHVARSAGFGYLFGDEGSGFGIARDALRAAMKAVDRDEPLSPLVEQLAVRFDVRDLRDMPMRFYNHHVSRDEVAAAARDVLAAADAGDPLASAVVKDGIAALVDMVGNVAARLSMSAPDVRMVGGMFRHVPYRMAFERHLRMALPEARAALPLLGPAEGAVMLALRRAGRTIDPAVLDALLASREVTR